ncbi:alpha/beta fold hydrolase [Naumannella sp. ID2617S]|nr:alpha/beta fold hydrolase [Naumannella sp. ID2617S]
MNAENPEIGSYVQTGDIRTNHHDLGSGAPLLLLHGSGPGVSAYANWRLVMQPLAEHARVLAPDLAGFGYTEIPDGLEFSRDVWLQQIVDFLDAKGLDKVDVVGNSFGGSMALALTIHHPERVNRLILMGSVGVPFELTEGLDAVWGYQPSPETMGRLMRETFAYNSSLITDEMVQGRYTASLRTQADFERMFPAPRQRWVDAMAHPEQAIRGITAPTLLIHGRDDKVIPLSTSLTMLEWIDDAQAHIFGRCGHWTQIEYANEFCSLVADFLAD